MDAVSSNLQIRRATAWADDSPSRPGEPDHPNRPAAPQALMLSVSGPPTSGSKRCARIPESKRLAAWRCGCDPCELARQGCHRRSDSAFAKPPRRASRGSGSRASTGRRRSTSAKFMLCCSQLQPACLQLISNAAPRSFRHLSVEQLQILLLGTASSDRRERRTIHRGWDPGCPTLRIQRFETLTDVNADQSHLEALLL